MKILVLGGTRFVGAAFVDAAQARGHTLTLFHRGTTGPGLFPGVETLHGDRDGGLQPLEGRRWDAVVDTCGYVPRIVRQSAELLAPATEQYVFVSTISVYASFDRPGADETAALATLPDPASEDVTLHYGALKALCEQAVETALPGRVATVRSGLVIGPRDQSGRFTYWPLRLERGGEILAPGSGADPVQVIDARDLADWLVHLVEQRTVGTFNALGPAGRLEMEGLLAGVAAGVGAAAPRLTWVDAAFLEQEKVSPWSDMPVWLPTAGGDYAGAGTISNARAVAAGLRFRSIEDSARATRDWVEGLDGEARAAVTSGLPPAREAEVLARWHARAARQKE